MKSIVFYKSISGFTKKYADWIAEDLKAESLDISQIGKVNLKDYDAIVFGGCVHMFKIRSLKKFMNRINRLKGKKIVVFATGGSPAGFPEAIRLPSKNFSEEQLKNLRFYYYQGGVNIGRLDRFNRFLMNWLKKMLLKKQNRTKEEQDLLDSYTHPTDFTNKDYAKELLEFILS